MIRVLLDAGSDPNAKIDGGWTPLHMVAAKFSEDPAEIQALLDAEADPNAKGSLGKTPLDVAQDAENSAAIEA